MKRSCLFTTLCWLAATWAHAEDGLTLNWRDKLLTVSGPALPGGKLEILYLEAFCHKDSTRQEWRETVLRHKTELVATEPKQLRFRTTIEPDAVMLHEVKVGSNGLDFQYTLRNEGSKPLDLEWFQPACIRVAAFTGLDQSNYISRSFIFTKDGLTTLDKTHRRQEALYPGGQVYVPKGINLADVNPRPICRDQPVNGLIGCFSADGQYLLATASSSTHELFEGVFVCLHSDPHVGSLAPRETKEIRAKLYIVKNDPQQLLKLYRRDFPGEAQ